MGRCQRFWRPDAAVHHLCRSSGQRIYVSPGATPEEQAAQSGVWNAVVFWSALFYHLPLLAHLEGELVSGKLWRPGMSSPDEAFRFRYRQQRLQDTEAQQLAAVMAGQLLPVGATALAGHCAGGITESGGSSLASASGDGIDSFSPENSGRKRWRVRSRIAGDGSRNSTFAPGKHCTLKTMCYLTVSQKHQQRPLRRKCWRSSPEVGEFTLQPSVPGTDEAEAVVREYVAVCSRRGGKGTGGSRVSMMTTVCC